MYTDQQKKICRIIFSLAAMLMSVHVNANECLNFLPASANKLGELKICESAYTGITSEYSCQDYQADTTRYRVFYKGGLIPKAITVLEAGQERLIWSTSFGDKAMRCPLLPPQGIPLQAEHRGTGMCHDEQDRVVPCSVYEYAPARTTEFHRYMALFKPNGQGTLTIDGYIAGNNTYAMDAEIAYQIGRSLLNTDCCNEQALEYIEYAYRLFPDSETYSKALHLAKGLLASN